METIEKTNGLLDNPKKNTIGFVVVILLLIACSSILFSVKEGEQASAFFFGKPTRDYLTPGLHVKWPWPIETINRVDKRLLLYTAREIILQEKKQKNLLIDWFCLWKVDNPKTYFTKVVNKGKAERRIDDNVSSDIAATLGENLFEDIVTNNRQKLLQEIHESSNKGLDDIDLSIKFLSFNRVELPNENKPAVFSDMIADRQKISNGFMAEGQKLQDSIKSNADYLASKIRSEAKLEAGIIKGRADSTRLALLNNAYNKSKELFRVYNEIETFKKSYSKNTEWTLTPDNLFPKR